MTRGFAVAALLTSLLATVAAGFAWWDRIDPAEHQAYTHTLLRAEELDAQLDAQIARARLGLVTQYDGVVRLTDAMDGNLARLRRPPPHAHVDTELHALEEALAQKVERLEAFKTDHAVLRNSLRLLPFLADRLTQQLPPSSPLHAATNAATASVLSGAIDPTGERRAQARCALVPLGGPRTAPCDATPLAIPDDHAAAVAALVQHATEVVQRRPVVDASVRAMSSAPVAARVRDLLMAYDRATQQASATQTENTTIVGVLAVLSVLLAALSVIARIQGGAAALREATTQLRQANDALQSTNEELKIERDRKDELAREVAAANDELATANEDLGRANEQLAVANTRLSDEAEQKSQYVSITSHEFRTPLTVIRQSAELLEHYGERWNPERRARHLHRILAKSEEMQGMLEQLLVIGRADSGLLEVHPAPLVVGELLDDVVSAVRAKRWEARALEVHDAAGTTPLALDEALVKRVLTNLLSNAFKYSPDHSVVRLSAHVDDDDAVSFSVSDEGIGIPKSDQASLFQPFQRCRNAADFEGTGLGLAVVQRSVAVHGGTIEVDSAERQGTRFVVRIPTRPRRPTRPTRPTRAAS